LHDWAKITAAEPSQARDDTAIWGRAVEGVQLSLEFEKNLFLRGEPVAAHVYVRNNSRNTIHFPGTGGEVGILLMAVSPAKQLVADNYKTLANQLYLDVPSNKIIEVESGAEKAYEVRFDTRFNTEFKGAYTIYAKLPFFTAEGRALEVISENALIHVVAEPSGSAPVTHLQGSDRASPMRKPDWFSNVLGHGGAASDKAQSVKPPASSNPGENHPEHPSLFHHKNNPNDTNQMGLIAQATGESSGIKAKRFFGWITVMLCVGTAWWHYRRRRAGPSSRNK